MNEAYKSAVRGQLLAAMDMLENALRDCPDALWCARLWPVKNGNPDLAAFWYIAFHTLFWLDYYLHNTPEGYTPRAPFTLSELDPLGLVPEPGYSRALMMDYLAFVRTQCAKIIDALTEQSAFETSPFSPRQKLNRLEMILYNLRHVQEHGAQLHLFIGQHMHHEQKWVGRGEAS